MSKIIPDDVKKVLEIVPEAYDDLLKPTTQETGKTLALVPRAINAALSPLRQWIAQKEYNVAETEKILAKKLENIPEEKIVTPEAYVAVPALQKLSYCLDSKELRELYANLLAKSMNTDTKDTVHPAYIETISQLSPMEAKYFEELCKLPYRPLVDVTLDIKNGLTMTLAPNCNAFSKAYEKHNFPLLLDNLCRLGLINIPFGIWYGDDAIYAPIISVLKLKYPFDKYKHLNPNSTGVSFDKKRIDVTTYGKNFYETCVKDK